MSKRRAAHESPKGQMRAIRRAMKDHGVGYGDPVQKLIDAVRDEGLRELGFYDDEEPTASD